MSPLSAARPRPPCRRARAPQGRGGEAGRAARVAARARPASRQFHSAPAEGVDPANPQPSQRTPLVVAASCPGWPARQAPARTFTAPLHLQFVAGERPMRPLPGRPTPHPMNKHPPGMASRCAGQPALQPPAASCLRPCNRWARRACMAFFWPAAYCARPPTAPACSQACAAASLETNPPSDADQRGTGGVRPLGHPLHAPSPRAAQALAALAARAPAAWAHQALAPPPAV
jgi:hypothetical protein